MSGHSTRTPETAQPVTADPVRETEDPVRLSYGENYENLYGDRFGGKIWDAVESNANPDKLDGYLGDLVDGGTSQLAELLNEHASPEDAALAMQAGGLLQSDLGGNIKNSLIDSNISENVFSYLGENPLQTGLLGAGAAALYIASDPDIDTDLDFNLSKNTELTLGGDFGSLFDLGLHEARAGLTHTDGNTQFGVNGSHNFDTDLSKLSAFYNTHNGEGTSFAADAFITDQGDRNTAGANLSYLTPSVGLTGSMNFDNAHPEFGEYGKFQANAFSRGESDHQWNLGAGMDTEGAYRVNGGYHWSNESSSFGITGHHGQDAAGNNDTGIMANFTHRF